MNEIATALRNVTVKMQQAIDAGQRSRAIYADDLIEVLLTVADELDPPFGEQAGPEAAPSDHPGG